MVAEIRLKMRHRYSFDRIADSRYDEACGAPRVDIPLEKMSVAVVGALKPVGSTKIWWSKDGVPRALRNAGTWGSIGASMMLSSQ